jgi:glucokinase
MNECFIGIDLGGTKVKIGLIKNDVIIDKVTVSALSSEGLEASLTLLEKEIYQLFKANNIDLLSLKGIGLAFPGLVDPHNKKILSTNAKYDDGFSINLENWIKDHWDVDFYIDNDARITAVGEWKYGEGKDTDNLVVMTIGTGIGTSAIIEGKLLRGKHFQAGCLGGHLSIQYNGSVCTCGNIGCLEAYGSTWSIKKRIINSPGFSKSVLSSVQVLDFEALFIAAKQQDILALSLLNECYEAWSAGIINLIHAYDPEVVVIGGGVMNNRDTILPNIIPRINKHAWCPWGKVDIRPSNLLSDAALLGSVYCLQHKV